MRSHISAAFLIATAGLLFACKPAPAPEPVAEEVVAEEATSTGGGMIEACNVRMAQPEATEWTTYWNTSAVPQDGDGPSSAHSEFWANEEEPEVARAWLVGVAT